MLWSMLVTAVVVSAAGDPCTNGSFEELGPSGFPVDWGAVGSTVEVTGDAHSGRRALRLARTAQTTTAETGLNRAKLMDRVRGGLDFWYKAPSAASAKLRIAVIPIGADGVERTGSLRAEYVVPASHVGDGQWHHARLKYDYTDNPKVKHVHFAARITGTDGELLLDDLGYVERVGPILRLRRLRLDEDPAAPGSRATLAAQIENAGDEPANGLSVALSLPAGLSATIQQPEGQPSASGDVALRPDETRWFRWSLEGQRTQPGTIGLRAKAGDVTVDDSLKLAPEMALHSLGPASPVAIVGQPITVECVVENPGNAILTDAVAEVALPSGPQRLAFGQILPGQSALRSVTLAPEREVFALKIPLRVRAASIGAKIAAETEVQVCPGVELPGPSGKLNAKAADQYALLENEHVRLVFRRTALGFGVGELQVKSEGGTRKAERGTPNSEFRLPNSELVTVAWLPRLSSIVWQGQAGRDERYEVFCAAAPEVTCDGQIAGLRFTWTKADPRGATWRLSASFRLGPAERCVAVQYELSCDQPRKLLSFQGPMLSVLNRDEAIFPGLEWLVGDEVSSGTLDIAEHHPDRLRYVVHPQMVTIPAIGIHSQQGTVGLLWDNRPRPDRPAVVFDSPNRHAHQRSHLAGLFLPSVPDHVKPNELVAQTPYGLEPGKPLRLNCHLYADGAAADALAAIEEYVRRAGLPEPAVLPRGSYEREIEFSMQAYLRSLWDAETKQWWTTKGGGRMSQKARPPAFVADLLLGELVSPDPAVAGQCRARAQEVAALIGGPVRLDAQRFPGRFDLAVANPAHAAALLASRQDDGSWRFDADQEPKEGPFVGRDYHQLGPDNAVEVGTCARRAYEVLRYARIAGDSEAYRQMEKTLELMERFRVPRAAQVWEVPVHTPDLLAAADAVDAFLEAYRFSGQRRWLDDAVAWARRGLPFLYLWDDPQKPFLLGASIPVFGATWHEGSWFGRPVQWNGLRYAAALLKLASWDQSQPWRKLAAMITHSAIHQQAAEGDDVALWPDNISAIDCKRCPWVFAPRQILGCVLGLMGRDEEPATVILGQGQRRLHVTAAARVSDASWDGSTLAFSVAYPPKEEGVVLVANVSRPEAVVIDGKPAPERSEVEQGAELGWRYDVGHAYLSIRITRAGPVAVRVQGARFQPIERLPRLVEQIAFEYDQSPEGWLAQHDIARLEVADGALWGTIDGPDPYLARSMLRIKGSRCPVIRMRLRVTAGRSGQWFWATEASPGFSEDKSLHFPLQPDGQFHEYLLDLGKHSSWAGQTITAIRLDPGGGAASAEFAVDYIRGAER